MTHEDVHKAADGLLRALDDAPLGCGIFRDQTAKDWMETSVRRALAKLNAASYHCANVARLAEGARDKAKKLSQATRLPSTDNRFRNATARTSVTFAVQEVAYEIDAFLAASRASLDFSANIVALHLGMNRRTGITSVLDWLKKSTVPPFAFVLERRHWIESLKAYRDECAHYRTLKAEIGYDAVRTKGVTAATTIPFIVAEDISAADDQPDTRARVFEFATGDHLLPEGFSRFETRGGITAHDCSESLFDHSIWYEPSTGYLLAEEFCLRHLDKLREFTAYLFEETPRFRFELQRRAPATRSKL